jgi:tetratricopeptide (TPR) repeat protein
MADLQQVNVAGSGEFSEQLAVEVRGFVAAVRLALNDRNSADLSVLTKLGSRLRQIPASVETEGQFEALQGICRFFVGQDKDLAYAMEAGAYLVRLARALDRKQELLNGLFLQAFIATQLENHVEAIEACAMAREVAIALRSPVGELKSLVNAAATSVNVGDYNHALDLLRTALTICDLCSLDEAARSEWVILTNVATCYLFLGQFENALKTAVAATAIAPEPTDAFAAGNLAILSSTHIRTLMALRRGSEGRMLLEKMAKHVAMAGTVRARIDYSTALGLVEIAEGHLDRGRSRIHASREKANIVRSTIQDVLSAEVAMHLVLGEDDEAAKVQGELDSILRSRQETARLRSALVMGGSVGVAGQTARVTEYDRRLEAARERLLRGGDRA